MPAAVATEELVVDALLGTTPELDKAAVAKTEEAKAAVAIKFVERKATRNPGPVVTQARAGATAKTTKSLTSRSSWRQPMPGLAA